MTLFRSAAGSPLSLNECYCSTYWLSLRLQSFDCPKSIVHFSQRIHIAQSCFYSVLVTTLKIIEIASIAS